MSDISPPPPPPPPPGGFGGPPGPAPGSGQPQGGGADIGAALSWAASKFGQNAVILIGLAAAVFVIRLIGNLVNRGLVNNLVGTNCNNSIVVNGQVITTTGPCVASLATTITAGVITAVIFGVLAWIATIGIYRAALKTTRGEAPAFSHLTSGENLGKYIVTAIVYGLLIGIGLVLCVIPGIVVAFLFQLAPFYALDRGASVGEALKASYTSATQNFVPFLLMTLVNVIASFVGGILFGVLTLVALPFAALFTAHVYRQLNGEAVSA